MRHAATGMAALSLLGGCVAPSRPRSAPAPVAPAPSPPLPPSPLAPVVAAPQALQARLTQLGQGFDGVAGIAVRSVRDGWSARYDPGNLFPQQSVSKLWVAITVFDAIDRGTLHLSDEVVIRPEDLTLFHQPVAALVGPEGYRTTIGGLLERALTTSDNTANDKLLWTVGGPDAVRAELARAGIFGIRFGPGERLLQSLTAGLEWRQSFAAGNRFEEARTALPVATRRAALQNYLADPIDGAAPWAIADAIARLASGAILSPSSTQALLALMGASKTGPERMRGGLAPGWSLAHKTGTGQELEGLATGYNDVGLLTAPDGRRFGVAVMIARTRRTIPERQRLMQDVVRAIIAADAAAP